MSEQEQFVSHGRYTVIPRTLVFLTNGDDVLLLKGAPTKRLWAGRYNGLGGHIDPGETFRAAALREVHEEARLAPEQIADFALRALINVEGTPQGVLLCVFVGVARTRTIIPSPEGTPEWVPIAALDQLDLVDERRLLPRLLHEPGLLFGHQRHGPDNTILTFTLE
jgi:8-oxo-dGTP diphosphatase